LQVVVAMLGIVLTLAYLFKMMRGLFYGPMNQKYSHTHDAISGVDRLPLLIMIAISVGFGIFPMHLYNVVRSGVDPLIARITLVTPIAESNPGVHQSSEAGLSGETATVPVVAQQPEAQTSQGLRGRE
jgi:NADH-quinone oxidoreductase subunit M